MSNEDLFWEFYRASGENEIHNILEKHDLMNNNSFWFPYGGKTIDDRNNFGTFESQQANPIPALIEKITNSIDSLLMLKCIENGVDPKSKLAPKTMEEAIEKYFNIKDGDFSEIGRNVRRNIAEEIQVIATGDKQSPDITVYDCGEGQLPEKFKDTFVSLLKGNKNDVPFVQGKYNMGSTGAVIFCGNKKYQLIGSKLNKTIGSSESPFGFTLVRRHPLTEEEESKYKSSWYEYLVIENEIPSFNCGELDLGLYNRKFECGSIIKMFSYGLPRGARSSVVWDLWRELNQFLYHPALPFLVYEKRGYDNKTPSKLVLGNKIRLILDERDKKEKTITTKIIDERFGEIPIEVHVFKNDVNQTEFINGKALIFTVNGQVQGYEKRNFISSELNFPMLKDHMLVRVDCTNIRTSIRTDLFKSSRDRLNESVLTEEFLDKIINVLKGNEELRKINQERKNSILRQNADDKKLFEDIITRMPLQNDFIKMFTQSNDFNFDLKNINKKHDRTDSSDGSEKTKKPIESKRFPSIFKVQLKDNNNKDKIKTIPINGKGVINFETDVEDEYLFRPKDKGELRIGILNYKSNNADGGTEAKPTKIEELLDVTLSGPTDNAIKATFEPKAKLNVGDEIQISTTLTSPSGDLECIFYIKIIDPQNLQDNNSKNKDKESLNLPLPIKVFENKDKDDDRTWSDYGWDGNDIVKIITDNENKEKKLIEGIAINMDSFVIKRYISKNKVITSSDLVLTKNRYFLSVYWHSIFLFKFLENIFKAEEYQELPEDVEEIVAQLMQFYSEFLLSFGMLGESLNQD
ncbi:MAG: hypothetical protein CVV21_02470 [Candidatus Goldiibacteriota bacterium HGW-Goldbacteria-1]|nr:MAG: hypothetical protein CVV21_02470 [Candidatus Goldiibacteriota bacterium HGW-Goldbacteria-1]